MTMNSLRYALAGLAGATLFTLAAALRPAAPEAGTTDPVARGKYLATIMMCNDCHTPWHMGHNGPEPDMSRMLSGHPAGLQMPKAPAATDEWPTAAGASMTAWHGPWGTSYTANLTPDPETGLGAWTSDTFVQALQTGKHMGLGRPILPPMPWPMYGQLEEADLRAIFAYLQSIPPIRNRVPEPLPPVAEAGVR
jgi:cytochrome c553